MTEKAKKLGNEHVGYNPNYIKSGITKREYFAAMALQGIHQLLQYPEDRHLQSTAKAAVKYADALLEELAK
jgi:hypothetical protein